MQSFMVFDAEAKAGILTLNVQSTDCYASTQLPASKQGETGNKQPLFSPGIALHCLFLWLETDVAAVSSAAAVAFLQLSVL